MRRQPGLADKHVGARLRTARLVAGKSQTEASVMSNGPRRLQLKESTWLHVGDEVGWSIVLTFHWPKRLIWQLLEIIECPFGKKMVLLPSTPLRSNEVHGIECIVPAHWKIAFAQHLESNAI
jgi:hypothetical protein